MWCSTAEVSLSRFKPSRRWTRSSVNSSGGKTASIFSSGIAAASIFPSPPFPVVPWNRFWNRSISEKLFEQIKFNAPYNWKKKKNYSTNIACQWQLTNTSVLINQNCLSIFPCFNFKFKFNKKWINRPYPRYLHLCTLFGTDGIKAISSGFSGRNKW